MISFSEFYEKKWVCEDAETLLPAHPRITKDMRAILDLLFDPVPLAPTVLLGLPKKVGKTSIMAGYLCYRNLKALADGRPYSTNVISSNSKEHGMDVLAQSLKYGIRGMADLDGLYVFHKDEIMLVDPDQDYTASTRVLSRGDSAVAGVNYGGGVAAVDELWAVSSTDVKASNRWAELRPPPGNAETVRLCASYAGLQSSEILRGLFETLALGQQVDPRYPVYVNGNLAGVMDDGHLGKFYSRPAWHTDEWLEAEYATAVNKASFRRQFFLEWAVSDGALAVEEEAWRALEDSDLEYMPW